MQEKTIDFAAQKSAPPPRDDFDRIRLIAALEEQHERSKKSLRGKGIKSQSEILARRALAFLLDCAALAAIGRVLGFALGSWFSKLGENGLWIGIAIAAAYFTLLDSRIGGGRTLGKRLFDIEVRYANGAFLSVPDAFLRFAPYAVVFSIVEFCAAADQHSAIILGLELVGAVVALSLVLYPILHPARLTSADLLFRTIVTSEGKAPAATEGRPRLPAAALLAAAAVAVSVQGLRAWRMASSPDAKATATLASVLRRAVPDVQELRVGISKKGDAGTAGNRTVYVKALLPGTSGADGAPAAAARISIAAEAGRAMPKNAIYLVVELESGYDIGIASELTETSFKFPVGKQKVLGEKPSVRFRTTSGASRR